MEATKPFKGEKKYEYDSLLSILNYLKLGKDQEAHSVVKLISNAKSPKVLFNTLQESFLGPVPVCLCFKESSSKYGYPVFLAEQSGKSIRKGRRKKGEAYRQHTVSGCCH